MGNPSRIAGDAGPEHDGALLRQARPAKLRAAQQAVAQPAQETASALYVGGASTPAAPPEAAQRFFARYGEIVGGNTWAAVQRYLRSRAPKPSSIEGWFATAEAVRDHAHAAAAAHNGTGKP